MATDAGHLIRWTVGPSQVEAVMYGWLLLFGREHAIAAVQVRDTVDRRQWAVNDPKDLLAAPRFTHAPVEIPGRDGKWVLVLDPEVR
jgi:hypothetical protein